MPSLQEILRDPNYINANEATKRAIFERYAPLDQNYTGANEATQAAIRRRFGIGQIGMPVAAPEEPAQGALVSGFKSYVPSLQETYGGLKTLLGVGAERILGEGAISKGLIESGAASMAEAEKARAPLMTKERGSFSDALEKGVGSVLTEWLPFQAGAGAAQVLEALALVGAGGLAGTATAPGPGTLAGAGTGLVARELAKRGVKEAAEKVLKERGEDAAKVYFEKAAKDVALEIGKKRGQTAALAGQAAFYGTGQTTSRAVEEAEKLGGTATDIELARVLPASAVATVAEFLGDKIALGALKGIKPGEPGKFVAADLAKNILLNIGLTGTKEVPVEVIQSAAERFGAKLSLTDAQALKEYIDSTAASYGMAVGPGGAGGVRQTMAERANKPAVAPAPKAPTAEAPPVEPPPVAPEAGLEQLTPQQKQELERQRALSQRPKTTEELLAEAGIQAGKPTTAEDIARIRDEHETAVIEGLLAQDAEMARANQLARRQLELESEAEATAGGISDVDTRVREGRIFARVQDLIDRNIPFASTAINEINQKFGVINEAPLTEEERARIENIMGMVNTFTNFVNLPVLAPKPVDRFAENQAMEALIKERTERGQAEPLRAAPPAPSPRIEEAPVSQGVGEGATLRPTGGVEPSVAEDRERVAPTPPTKPTAFESQIVSRQPAPDGMEVHVFATTDGYGTGLFDADAGQYVNGSVTRFAGADTLPKAEARAAEMLRKATPVETPSPFMQRLQEYWKETVTPAVKNYLDAFNSFGVDRLEANQIKPSGMSAREWLESFVSKQSTWDKGRKTGETGIQALSTKNLWPTTDGSGERLRKAMLDAVKALKNAPGSTSELVDQAFGKSKLTTTAAPKVEAPVTPAANVEEQTTPTEEAKNIVEPTIRSRLKEIARNLGVLVFETGDKYSSGNGVVNIPTEDKQVEGAQSPEHVFAHELGHAILQNRSMSFNGMPNAEVAKWITGWDGIKAISKAFRPEIHNHKLPKFRRHANKPDEIIADALGSFLLGNSSKQDIAPLIKALNLNDFDLGIKTRPVAAEVSAPKAEVPAVETFTAKPAAEASAAEPTTLTTQIGGSDTTLDLGKPVWQATDDDLVQAVKDSGAYLGKPGSKYDPYMAWREAHNKAIQQAKREGKPFPAEVLYDKPRLIRDDLSDSQADEAIDAMVNVYRATKDYGKAVEAYRNFGKKPKAEAPVAPEIAPLQEAYNKAKAALDAIGTEPAKPSPEARYFGMKGREGAAPELVRAYDEKVKAYNSWRRKYLKLKKEEVEASNILFRAKQAQERKSLGKEQTKQLQDFQQTLRNLLNKFGLKDVGLNIEEGMRDAGSYSQQLIRIASDEANPIRTLRHEAIHALRELGFFTDAQWKSLSKMAKDKWIDQYLKQRNEQGRPLKAGEESRYDAYMREYNGDMEKITEEAVADAFADFDATKPPAGMLQALLKRMRDLFQSIKSALTKIESPEQIFGKVEKGELKAGAKAEAGERKSLGKVTATAQKALQKQPMPEKGLSHVSKDLVNLTQPIFFPQNKTIIDRIEGMKDRFWQRLAQGTADQFRTIKEYSPTGYMQARLSKSIDGSLEGLLFHGQVFDDGGALNIKSNTKGMMDILKPIGTELDSYLMWVALNRESRLPEDKRSKIPNMDKLVARRAEFAAGELSGKPRVEVYQDVLRQMNQLNKSVLDVALAKGLIDKKGYDTFSNDIYYIPFYKKMEEDGTVEGAKTASGLTSQEFSKELKGSEAPFGDLMENIVRNWSHILSASMKNAAAQTTVKDAMELQAAEPNLKAGLKWRDGKVYSTKNDKPIEAKFDEDGKQIYAEGELRPDLTTSGTGMAKIMVDGQPMYFKVIDELLMDSISSIGYMGPKSKFLDVARGFKNMLQYGVTASPIFKVNNLIRDSVSALAVSDLKKSPVYNVMTGISLSKKDSPTYISALAGGAIFNFGSAYEGDQAKLIKRLIDQGVDGDTILDTKEKITKALKKTWDAYQHLGDRSEAANRLALYQQMRDKGMSHLQASFMARDLLDFSMQGSWPAFRLITQVVPFMNARIQGLYKLGRDGINPTVRVLYNATTGKEIDANDKVRAAQFSVVTAAVMAASALLYLSFKDDEDFKKRDAWDRDNFWWFKIPSLDIAFRVPKPFEVGAFGTLVERSLEQIYDQGAEGKTFADSLKRTLWDTFALNPTPQMFKPLFDLYANKDSFSGAPIESAGLERLSKQERMTEQTSPLAIALSKVWSTVMPEKVESSPVQVDYAIKGYFGWLGAMASMASTYAVMPFKEGEYPDARWLDRASLGLVRDLPAPQSAYVTAFYENAKEISQAYADMRHYREIGDAEKVQELLEEKGDKIMLAKFYDKTSKNIANVRKQIQFITNDKTLDGATKKEEIERMKLIMSDLAKQAEEVRKSMKP